MREREEPKEPMWKVLAADNARHYTLGSSSDGYQFKLKTRGKSWVLRDRDGLAARGSHRRADRSIVIRNAQGAIIGRTHEDSEAIEVRTKEGEVLARLLIEGKKSFRVRRDGSTLAVIQAMPDGGLEATVGESTLHGARRLNERGEAVLDLHDSEEALLATLEESAGLDLVGLALLWTEELSAPLRLGLAMHIAKVNRGTRDQSE